MSLQPGRRLSQYEIVESIGRGGMGEVYRAHDTQLGRDVAIKVLPDELARDRERLDRFEREARLLAQLNHANVATLHGLEEADGVRFLVMELVDGETLHERIARGRLSADEATRVFTQIADGLEAAHAKGVVHRDLKPANIKITADGGVKILDFGLAKAVVAESSQSESPTMTRGTTDGVILGTAPYMSPEQARGKDVDAQTDVWAFGCCLFEALTGRAAFLGETVSDTLARVIEREPDWKRLPESTPTGIRTLLTRALAKDKRDRLHHIGDARLELEAKREAPASMRGKNGYKLLALAMGLLAAVLGWIQFRAGGDVDVRVTRTLLAVSPSDALELGYFAPSIAISPNGRYVAYVGVGEKTELQLRAIDQFDAVTVSGSEGATIPFFSPDSASLAFWRNGSLMKVSVHGGAPTPIAETRRPRGASWGAHGMIVLNAPNATGGGLLHVSREGGDVETLSTPDLDEREKSHRLPDVLPGGRGILFTLVTGDIESFDDAAIAVLSLEDGRYRTLIAGGTNPRYTPSGHIVYARGGRLWAVPFDPASLQITGAAVAVVDDVAMSNVRSGAAEFDISRTGDLVYASGGPHGASRRVGWVDRRGNSEVLVPGPGPFDAPRLSPDGESIALSYDGANGSVWIYERARTTLSRFASGFDKSYPIWTPDGRALTFSSGGVGGVVTLVEKPSDGSGESRPVVESPHSKISGSWSPDGEILAFTAFTADLADIWIQRVGEDTPRPLMAEAFNESEPMISPDGKWIAYVSDESGQSEIYLRSFPELGPKFRVSTDGGTRPRWPSSGRELFYWNVDRMLVVDIDAGGEPIGRPRVLFEASEAARFLANSIYDGYDVAPDGQHFVMIEETEPSPTPTHLHLVTNWASELERLVPPNR